MTKAKLTFLPQGLTLRDDQFEGLHKRVDSTRSTSKTITVDRESFMRLLNDYSLLLAGFDDVERVLRGGTPVKDTIKEKARERVPEDPDGDGSKLI